MKRANRILLLVTQADWGGVQSFLVTFAAALKADGREVMIAAGGPGELYARAREAGIACHELRHMKRSVHPLEDALAVRELTALIDELKPDAIDLNSSKMGILGSIAAHVSKTKPWTVYRIGGWSFLEPMSETSRLIYRSAEKWTAPFKDIIVTVHPGDAELATRLGFAPRHAIESIPNGIDVARFEAALIPRDDARRALELPLDGFVFGTVSNAYPAKALAEYLSAMDPLLREHHRAHVAIIGSGPLSAELEALRQTLPTKGQIHLIPRRMDAKTLLRAFDAFVLPSKKEGMPWALLEAMAAGLPCLATDVGACRYMLDADGEPSAGLIVPPMDAGALVAAATRIMEDDTLRHTLGTAAHEAAERRFPESKMIEAHMRTLDGE